jgi:translation initiation factor eIF-2B subunit epsilon
VFDEGSELSDDDDDNNDLNDSWADNDLSDGEDMDDGMENEDGEHDDVKNFKREVMESLQRAETDGSIVTDNLVLEINSSKHAWNTTLCEVNQCVLESVLALGTDFTLPPAKLLAKLKANIMKFKQLLLKYSLSKSGQDYYMSSIPELIKRFPPILEVIAKILHLLYELDILGEDAILKWSSKLQDTSIKSKIQGFLDWLQEDDSEESGSSEEDDSE